jgi:hypothetical protein
MRLRVAGDLEGACEGFEPPWAVITTAEWHVADLGAASLVGCHQCIQLHRALIADRQFTCLKVSQFVGVFNIEDQRFLGCRQRARSAALEEG